MSGHDRDHDVRTVVGQQLPGYRVRAVEELGAGLENVAYEVNGELIVRFSQAPEPAERAKRVTAEAQLLIAVADISPLPVPEPLFVAAAEGCLAYHKLPGVPLLSLAQAQRSSCTGSVAAALGAFLGALHAAPVASMAGLVGEDDPPLVDWRREAAEGYPTIVEAVPRTHRGRIEAFLGAPVADDAWTPVFSHNDLGIEHVLVDPPTSAVTGVIDWSDAAICDPAYDFGLLHRDLGAGAVHIALKHYPGDVDHDAIRERALFYARCTVLEDLAYGLQAGREVYVERSLAVMARLFRT